jgi:release factor glutamine methyltransferase
MTMTSIEALAPPPPLYRDLLARLEETLVVLPDKPDETPATTLNCLWAMAAGQPLAVSQAGDAVICDLSDAQADTLRALIDQRLNGTPLAYLVGRQDFMGLVLTITSAALVPRRETEILGRAALGRLHYSTAPSPLVIDLCTGCGNLALALAAHAPHARVFGSDLSEDAVALAQANAQFIGRPDVTFVSGDLAEPFNTDAFLGHVDVLTCNPPYISSAKVDTLHQEIRDHEPRMAFDGGPFGIRILQRLIQDAPRLLKPGGWLLFEVGLRQGEALRQRLARSPAFDTIGSHPDSQGDIRTLAARRRMEG